MPLTTARIYHCQTSKEFNDQLLQICASLRIPDAITTISTSGATFINRSERYHGPLISKDRATAYVLEYIKGSNRAYGVITGNGRQLFSEHSTLITLEQTEQGWLALLQTRLPLSSQERPTRMTRCNVEKGLTEIEFDESGTIHRIHLAPLPIIRIEDVEVAIHDESVQSNLDFIYDWDVLTGKCIPKIFSPTGSTIPLTERSPRVDPERTGNDLDVEFHPDMIQGWFAPNLINPNAHNLVPGTKLIRLAKNASDKMRVMYWNENRYGTSDINPNDFSRSYYSSQHSITNFSNDLRHIIDRISNDKVNDQFRLIRGILQQGLLTIPTMNREAFLTKVVSFENFIRVEPLNKPGTLDKAFRLLTPLLDFVESNGRKWSENTLIIPLSEEWFLSDPFLRERYYSQWMQNHELNRLGGDIHSSSGEGVSDPSELAFIFNELTELRAIIDKTLVQHSPESYWLRKLPNELSCTRMIFFHQGTWYIKRGQRYASFIGLMNYIGPVYIPALLTVLLHELNVNTTSSSILPQGDTHIMPEYTEASWYAVSRSGGLSVLKEVRDTEDNLYQCSRNITAVYAAAFIRFLQ